MWEGLLAERPKNVDTSGHLISSESATGRPCIQEYEHTGICLNKCIDSDIYIYICVYEYKPVA